MVQETWYWFESHGRVEQYVAISDGSETWPERTNSAKAAGVVDRVSNADNIPSKGRSMHDTKLDLSTKEIYTCVFAPDGTRAITGAEGNSVALWDTTISKCLQTFMHTGPVWALAWSSDQQLFLSLDGTMRLWETETGRCLREFAGRRMRGA